MNRKQEGGKPVAAFIVGGVALLALVLLPISMNVGRYVLSLLFTFFIYIVLSQSWNLVGGYTGQFNLGLAAYFGSGVLSCSLFYNAGLDPFLSLFAAGLVSVALACVIGIPTMRLKGVYFSIGTLALAEALRMTVSNVWPTSLYVPATHFERFHILANYFMAMGLAVLTILVVRFVATSRMGMALKAIRDDEEAAMSIGVSPTRHKVMVFVISSFLAGLAGGVFTLFRGVITPTFQFLPEWTFGPLVAACIGGLGTVVGPILGTVVFVILQEVFSQTLGKMHFIVTGIFFIVVILFLPRGLVQSGESIRRLVRRKP
jgi:branched-chain amino acid transport system permease protein